MYKWESFTTQNLWANLAFHLYRTRRKVSAKFCFKKGWTSKKYKHKIRRVRTLKKTTLLRYKDGKKTKRLYWYMHIRGRVALLFSISTIVLQYDSFPAYYHTCLVSVHTSHRSIPRQLNGCLAKTFFLVLASFIKRLPNRSNFKI